MKLNRRKTVLGLGAMATGSGAVFTSASVTNAVNAGSDFRIIAEPGLTLRRGAAFGGTPSNDWAYGPNATNGNGGQGVIKNDGSGIAWDNLNPADLPVVWANEDEDGSLRIELARENEVSNETLENLIEVENTGTTDERVGIDYSDGYAPDGTESWYDDETYSPNSGSEIGREHIQDTFRFISEGGSKISSDSDGGDPSNYTQVTPGVTEQIDLKHELTDYVEEIFADNAGGNNSGNPFSDDPTNTDFQLLDEIKVGTDT